MKNIIKYNVEIDTSEVKYNLKRWDLRSRSNFGGKLREIEMSCGMAVGQKRSCADMCSVHAEYNI